MDRVSRNLNDDDDDNSYAAREKALKSLSEARTHQSTSNSSNNGHSYERFNRNISSAYSRIRTYEDEPTEQRNYRNGHSEDSRSTGFQVEEARRIRVAREDNDARTGADEEPTNSASRILGATNERRIDTQSGLRSEVDRGRVYSPPNLQSQNKQESVVARTSSRGGSYRENIDVQSKPSYQSNTDNRQYPGQQPPRVASTASPGRYAASSTNRSCVIDINIIVSFGEDGPSASVNTHNARARTSPAQTRTVLEDVRYIDLDYRLPSRTALLETDGVERYSGPKSSNTFSNANNN